MSTAWASPPSSKRRAPWLAPGRHTFRSTSTGSTRLMHPARARPRPAGSPRARRRPSFMALRASTSSAAMSSKSPRNTTPRPTPRWSARKCFSRYYRWWSSAPASSGARLNSADRPRRAGLFGAALRAGFRVHAGDQRQDLAVHVMLAQRADMAITDMPGSVHDIGLRHSVDSEIDRGCSVLIDANAMIGVADIAEKMACIGQFVLIRNAVEDDAGRTSKRHQGRLLLAAWPAP